MKIDFYISSLSGGGAEKVLTCVANKLANIGNDVSIVSLEKRPQFYIPAQNVNVVKIENNGRFAWFKDYLDIRRYMKKSNADVAISFLSRCNILLLLACLFTSQKIVVSDRNNPLKEHSKYIFYLQNLLYLCADRVIVQTEQIKSYYWRSVQNKTTVIENPIDTLALDRQIEEMPQRENVILSVGRLEKQKDFKTLIKAFKIVHKKYSDWKVKVFGCGGMQYELQKCVDEAGMTDYFIFCGRTKKPYLEMRKASVFVLSSFYEGFPNVLCEAMYAGDLCIASDCVSGPRELIINGKNGWLFDIGDADHLAKLISECIEKQDEMIPIREAAENTVKRLYLDKNIEKWIEMIKGII